MTFQSKILAKHLPEIESIMLSTITTINKVWPKANMKPVKIVWDIKGKVAGRAILHRDPLESFVRMNPVFLEFFGKTYLDETLPHELAHIAVRLIWGFSKSIKPHGKEWKQVMAILGANPARCHNYEVPANATIFAKSRRKMVVKYKCGCSEHDLSITRHNRVVKKGAVYRCLKCKKQLVQIGKPERI